MTLFMGFLPCIGFHCQNHLYYPIPHTSYLWITTVMYVIVKTICVVLYFIFMNKNNNFHHNKNFVALYFIVMKEQ